MSLTLHIVRKDLVRMRGWIACWVTLLLLPLAMGAWFIGHNPLVDREWHGVPLLVAATGAEVLFAWLLTILVIQDDAVVGTQAFWLTRPISRARLLVAKLLSVLAIVALVPLVVSLPWWLWCGFGVAQIGAVASQGVVLIIALILPAALVAVLTDSFARALLWSVALLALVLFVGFFFSVANTAIARGNREMALMISRPILAVLVILLEMAALIVVRYLWRPRLVWVVAAAGIMMLSVATAMRWPWPLFGEYPPAHHAERASGFEVVYHRSVAEPKATRKEGPVLLQCVESQFILRGLPSGLDLRGVAAQQRWTWPNDLSITRLDGLFSPVPAEPFLGLRNNPSDPETQREKQRRLKIRVGRDLAPNEFLADAPAWLPPSLVERIRQEPPKFNARLWFQLSQPELRLEVPLAPGKWRARNGHGVGIAALHRDSDTMTITLVATRPSLLTPIFSAFGGWAVPFAPDREQSWALLDRARGRVVYTFSERNADKPRTIAVNGVRIEWRTHTTVGPSVVRGGRSIREPDWTMGTSLAVVTMRELALFSRDVTVERIELAK